MSDIKKEFTVQQLMKYEVAIDLLQTAARTLQKKGIDQWSYWLNPPSYKVDWLNRGLEDGEYYLIKVDDETAGMYRLSSHDIEYWGEQSDIARYVHSLVVLPTFGGIGLGENIMKYIERKVSLEGINLVRLDCHAGNERLCRYYENLGFNKVGTKQMPHSHNNLFQKTVAPSSGVNVIALGTGCFWCTEAILSQISGVIETEIGYGGGRYIGPTYTSVSAKPDGHAELTRLFFDTGNVSLESILDVFFDIHDPKKTISINDKKGELYRSVILYNNEQDKLRILKYIAEMEAHSGCKIATEVRPFGNYKAAAPKYQNYFASDLSKPFCNHTISPKLATLRARGVL